MADLRPFSDLRPIAPALLQRIADFDVKVFAHAPIIAKFCETGKQHIASAPCDSLDMGAKTLNQVLGTNLKAILDARGLSNLALSKMAGVSANTIGNYIKAGEDGADREISPSSGKERSAKLTEVEMIAAALDVDPLSLLTDPQVAAAKARQVAAAVAKAMAAPAAQIEGQTAPGAAVISVSPRERAA
jgi:transcriptional regulator with XRE-family HTH domain